MGEFELEARGLDQGSWEVGGCVVEHVVVCQLGVVLFCVGGIGGWRLMVLEHEVSCPSVLGTVGEGGEVQTWVPPLLLRSMQPQSSRWNLCCPP